MFQLTKEEANNLYSSVVFQTGTPQYNFSAYAPFAFTEQGVCNLIVLWLFGLKTEFQWTDEPILMALNRNRKCRRFLSFARNLPLIRGFQRIRNVTLSNCK